jgi:flavin reductase (DIM6/NTAB) family NADH-FMN oxidoreductase RutF
LGYRKQAVKIACNIGQEGWIGLSVTEKNRGDQRAYRDALGQFPTGVALVASPSLQGWVVMTINSLTSLSLDPPLIGWSVDRNSERFSPFVEAEGYGVSVLDAEQSALARDYARRGDLFDEVAWSFDAHSAIRTQAVASFRCRMRDRFDVGDHVMLVGEVYEWQGNTGQLVPMVFARGQFTGPAQIV